MSSRNGPPIVSRSTRRILRVLFNTTRGVQDVEMPALTQVPYDQVCSSLARLVQHQWVQRDIVVTNGDENGLIHRRVYTLTEEGRAQAFIVLGMPETKKDN